MGVRPNIAMDVDPGLLSKGVDDQMDQAAKILGQ